MERKFYNVLMDWKNTPGHKPLLVKGARQVGKTYIIDEFCQKNYKNILKFDLIQDNSITNIFNEDKPFEMKLADLELLCGCKLDDDETILFVDEVQKSEKFIEALKYFYESGKKYNIICAGSLLGVALNRMKASYPVRKVIEETLYPMDFEEFLMATGNERYISVIHEHYRANEPLSESIHTILLDLVKRYMCLGGMPDVIQDYIDNNGDLLLIDKEITKTITEQYFEDMSKYNENASEHIRIKRIYEDIPAQLGKENQKFTFNKIDKVDNRKKDYISPIDWLLSSSLILMCKTLEVPKIPLKTNALKESYKLFLNDTGLLMSLSETPFKMIFSNDDYSYKGVIAENYVGTELAKKGISLYYWSRKGKNKGNAEVDFVIQKGLDVIPIEVKYNKDTKSKSLEIYNEEYKPKYAIRVSGKNFGFQNNIKSVPLYAVFCIDEVDE